jgi:hypothetical protein
VLTYLPDECSCSSVLTMSKRREKLFSCQTTDSKNCEGYYRWSREVYGISYIVAADLTFWLKNIFKVSIWMGCSSIISKYSLDKDVTKNRSLYIVLIQGDAYLNFAILFLHIYFWLASNWKMTLPKGLRSGTGYRYGPLFEQVTRNESLGERSMLLFSSKIIEPKLNNLLKR